MSLRKISNLPLIEDFTFRSDSKPLSDDLFQVSIENGGEYSSAGVKHSDLVESFPLGTTELIDEDDMVSDSVVHVPTQQSVKSYVDNIQLQPHEYTTNGYQKLPSGLIMQWGICVTGSNVNFPTPFTVNVLNIQVTQLGSSYSHMYGNEIYATIIDNVKFLPRHNHIGSDKHVTVYWFAIGY